MAHVLVTLGFAVFALGFLAVAILS